MVDGNFTNDRQTVLASAALDDAMKVYNAPIRQANVPIETGEPTFPDTQTRSQEASPKFAAVAVKFSSTNPGKLARYYEALTLLDLEKQNQALESLKKLWAAAIRNFPRWPSTKWRTSMPVPVRLMTQ